MTDKEIRKLSRAELLEMLVVQTKEVDRLQEQCSRLQTQLDEREMTLKNAGDIANAALGLNKVFQTAQTAADFYLESIRKMEAETKENCQRMEQETKEQCDRMLRSAKEEAKRFWRSVQYEVRDYKHYEAVAKIIEASGWEKQAGDVDG